MMPDKLIINSPSFIIAQQVLNRTSYKDSWKKESLFIPSVKHRRVICTQISSSEYLSLKGVGWVHGPPWSMPSPVENELWYGLMDEESAKKEILISSKLKAYGIHCSYAHLIEPLSQNELSLIGVSSDPTYNSGRLVRPVVLITKFQQALRIADLTPATEKQWHEALLSNGPHKCDKTLASKNLINKIYNNIIKYQCNGAVNDTLSPDNVSLLGEITDFERIYISDTSQIAVIEKNDILSRQRSEAYYFFDIVRCIIEYAELRCSVQSLLCLLMVGANRSYQTPFEEELAVLIS